MLPKSGARFSENNMLTSFESITFLRSNRIVI